MGPHYRLDCAGKNSKRSQGIALGPVEISWSCPLCTHQLQSGWRGGFRPNILVTTLEKQSFELMVNGLRSSFPTCGCTIGRGSMKTNPHPGNRFGLNSIIPVTTSAASFFNPSLLAKASSHWRWKRSVRRIPAMIRRPGRKQRPGGILGGSGQESRRHFDFPFTNDSWFHLAWIWWF